MLSEFLLYLVYIPVPDSFVEHVVSFWTVSRMFPSSRLTCRACCRATADVGALPTRTPATQIGLAYSPTTPLQQHHWCQHRQPARNKVMVRTRAWINMAGVATTGNLAGFTNPPMLSIAGVKLIVKVSCVIYVEAIVNPALQRMTRVKVKIKVSRVKFVENITEPVYSYS